MDLKPLQAGFLYLVGLASSVALFWFAGVMAFFLPDQPPLWAMVVGVIEWLLVWRLIRVVRRRLIRAGRRQPWSERACDLAVWAVTVLVLWGAVTARGFYLMEKAHRLYETRISFSAEGRNIELAAIIEIRATGVAKTVLAGPDAITTQSTLWVGQRLPSGAAVVFHLPDRSGLAKLVRDQERAKASSIDYLPVAYWLDDADDPSVIETLVFKAYHEQLSPRLRVHSFSVRRIDEGAVTDPRQQVGWLAKIGDASRFQGLHADVVPESMWREIPEVAAMPRGITEPQVLSREDSDRISAGVRICTGNGYGSDGIPIREGFVWARGRWDDKCREASVRLRPIRQRDGRFELALDEAGMMVDYSDFAVPEQMDLDVDGQRFPVDTNTRRWQFDPATRLLLTIQPNAAFYSRITERAG